LFASAEQEIVGPLADRLEFIDLPGYVQKEKASSVLSAAPDRGPNSLSWIRSKSFENSWNLKPARIQVCRKRRKWDILGKKEI